MAIFVVLALAAMAGVKAVDRSEFAFLNALGPTNVAFPGKLRYPPPSGSPDYRFEVFLFDRDAKAKVLAALKRELSPAQGYKVMSIPSGKEVDVTFTRGTAPNQYGAIYTTESLMPSLWADDLPKMSPGGCVVIVARESTWWEAKWKAFLRFLHLEK